ncbi:tld domain-containing protein 1 [Plakobranchus ocellatus]|uniref:MTOR-associated protein MEAK7 n=1 Tax=Plakobranchus ocellatus TaxID=259542 RepID=A0AAV4BAW4_9GAST|nr:tld domain-containing protein 1 [Plakobranchus ocellatus]
MGGSESKSSDVKHELLFTEEERARVQDIFCTISHSHKTFNKENLLHFTTPVLDHLTSSRLFYMIEGPVPEHKHHSRHPHHHRHHSHPHSTHHPHENVIHFHHFASHLAVLLKGDVTELSHACIFLASTNPSPIPASDLVQFVGTILHSYEKLLTAHCTAYQSWIFSNKADEQRHERLACSLLSSLLKAEDNLTVGPNDEPAETSPTLSFHADQVEEWLSRCHIFLQVLRQVLKGTFQFYPTEPHQIIFQPRLPQVRDTNWSRFSTILDFSSVLFLNAALPMELQTQWKLIYSNVLHGHSFSRFLQCVTGAGQPSVLVVKDKKKRIFGGFASIPWRIGPKFIGDHACFLFQVGSIFNMYKPTGYNSNYMYLNTQQQTLPNGLGMGGQFEYFGLWIDQSFDHGHSKAGIKGCTTYGSPQLSEEPEFKIDYIEVWAVGRKKKDNEDEDDDDDDDDEYGDEAKGGKQKSLLDKLEDADKALLDFVDRGTRSDHLREEPIVEETKAHNIIMSPF